MCTYYYSILLYSFIHCTIHNCTDIRMNKTYLCHIYKGELNIYIYKNKQNYYFPSLIVLSILPYYNCEFIQLFPKYIQKNSISRIQL